MPRATRAVYPGDATGGAGRGNKRETLGDVAHCISVPVLRPYLWWGIYIYTMKQRFFVLCAKMGGSLIVS